MLRHVAFCLLLFLFLAPSGIGAQSRRAILVGIDVYNPEPSARPAARPAVTQRPKVDGDPSYWQFLDLAGAANDVDLMEGVLRSFGFTDIVILKNQDATADAILSTLQKNLVDDAQAGDVRVFYYSGHGNHIKNLASKETGGEDQTIVPADNWRNVPDIRDKEISRILWQAARKGVIVTFIADSCHSGSLSRGVWNARGQARTNIGIRGGTKTQLREPVVNDAATIDPQTNQPIDPEKLGVLTLAAAQPTEEALEADIDPGDDPAGGRHGAFTWALAHALKSPNEPMQQVFQRTVAAMRASASAQLPVMGGIGRASLGIFGDSATGAGLTVAVQSVEDGRIRVLGGTAIGVYPHCTFKSLAKPPVELEISASDGISASWAQVVGSGEVKPGDLFVIDRLVVPASTSLRVYIPNPAPADVLSQTVSEIGKLRNDAEIEWVSDATVGRPTHVMSWTGSTWVVERNPASGRPEDSGPHPTAVSVRKLLPAHARFLLLLPPSADLAASLKLGEGEFSAVQPTRHGTQNTPAGAHYWFYGRLHGDDIEYAWLLPDSTEESVRQRAGEEKKQWPGGYFPLPIRSDWIKLPATPDGLRTAAAALREKALRLARIRAWFTLESPAGDSSFPYQLALRNVGTGQFAENNDLREGEKFKIYMRADPKQLEHPEKLERRWVYVFALDHFGAGTLLFPEPGRGNLGNQLPYTMAHETPKFEPLIALNGGEEEDFSIAAPFGVDSYFLVASKEPIDNLEAFQFDGIRTQESTRGAALGDPLTNLLMGASSSTRGVAPRSVPAHWSIETLTLRSVPQ
jgi:hypothetical protein